MEAGERSWMSSPLPPSTEVEEVPFLEGGERDPTVGSRRRGEGLRSVCKESKLSKLRSRDLQQDGGQARARVNGNSKAGAGFDYAMQARAWVDGNSEADMQGLDYAGKSRKGGMKRAVTKQKNTIGIRAG